MPEPSFQSSVLTSSPVMIIGFPLKTDFRSLVSVHNASAFQVVGTQFHRYAVAGEDADEILPHAPRNVGQHFVATGLELHFEHCIRQRLEHRRHDFNRVFFGQSVSSASLLSVRTSAPSGVTAPCACQARPAFFSSSAAQRRPPPRPLPLLRAGRHSLPRTAPERDSVPQLEPSGTHRSACAP